MEQDDTFAVLEKIGNLLTEIRQIGPHYLCLNLDLTLAILRFSPYIARHAVLPHSWPLLDDIPVWASFFLKL